MNRVFAMTITAKRMFAARSRFWASLGLLAWALLTANRNKTMDAILTQNKPITPTFSIESVIMGLSSERPILRARIVVRASARLRDMKVRAGLSILQHKLQDFVHYVL